MNIKSFIKQQNGDGFIKRRKVQKIIRCKRYNKTKDPDNYYRVDMMLYVPWRDEEDEIENNISDIRENYTDVVAIVNTNKMCFERVDNDRFEDAIEYIEKINNDYIDKNEKTVNQRERDYDRMMLFNEGGQELMNDFDELNAEPNNLSYDEEDSIDIEDENGNRYRNMTIEQLERAYGYQIPVVMSVAKAIPGKSAQKELNFPPSTGFEALHKQIKQLNERQQLLLINTIKYLFTGQSFKIFLSGKGGTGKSSFIKAFYQTSLIISNPENNPLKLPTLISSYTGLASFNVNGRTLHSLFGINPRISSSRRMEPLGEKRLLEYQKLFEHTKSLIIDEISMVSAKLWSCVSQRLQQIKACKEPFGGISVLAVGDLNQLPPVQGKYVFMEDSDNAYDSLNIDSLWSGFKLFELTEQMRQKNDKEYAEILDVMGEKGLNYLSQEQVDKLDTRIVNIEDVPKDVPIITFENANVDFINKKRIVETAGPYFPCKAKHVSTGTDKHKLRLQMRDIESETRLEKTGGSPLSINFKIGCSYMLTSNNDISDGLCNGSICTLKKIIMETDPNESLFEGIYFFL